MVNDSLHNQKEGAGPEFMTSINLVLPHVYKICQGGSSGYGSYPFVNWHVFSIWGILYLNIVLELLIVNIKYNKSQNFKHFVL